MKVNVCIITRNEEALLPKAVESVRGLADEVVVGDTGSTDSTIDVAKSLGCTVIEGLDRFNKGESRNIVANHSKCDWVVIVDCDETVQDPAGIRSFLEKTQSDAVYIKLQFKDGDVTTLEYLQLRMWRQGYFNYKYRAHELPIEQKKSRVVNSGFVWEHRPPKERAEWKLDYTLKRLLLDVKENPDSPRCKFYLARQYVYMKKWGLAIRWFSNYLNLPDHDEADAYYYLSRCYAETGHNDKSIKCLHLACAIGYNRRDLFGALAEVYYSKKMYTASIGILQAALLINEETSFGYKYPKWYGSHIYDLLARSYYYAGMVSRGIPYATMAVSLSPNDARLKNNLRYFTGDSDGKNSAN